MSDILAFGYQIDTFEYQFDTKGLGNFRLNSGEISRIIDILWMARVLEEFLQETLKKGGIKMSRMVKVMAIMVIVGGILNAQSGPSWLQMGNLLGAYEIFDILEIPNTNVVIAAGLVSDWSWHGGVWKSVDGGHTWTRKAYYGGLGFYNLQYDTLKNIIFALGDIRYFLIYSTNHGEQWHEIYYPYFIGDGAAMSSVLVNGKLYAGFYTWMNHRYYSPVLLRLDYSDPDTNNWYWELICQYPELQDTAGVFQLLYKDNKIFVFGEDKGGNGIRIYTYDISTLDKMAKPIGTVAEMAQYWKKRKEELADNKRPNGEIKGMQTFTPVELKK